ncbi:MAG: GNAT family N-acetyltransferase [Sporolactobacillus sp.]
MLKGELSLATKNDLSSIMAITDQAKVFLKSQGVDQWQNGYPALGDFEQDIRDQDLFVFKLNDQVAAYAALIAGPDEHYKLIEDGEWLNQEGPYYAIHRVAVSEQFRGQQVAQRLFERSLDYLRSNHPSVKSVRVDTHPENQIMQHVLTKVGFKRTGNVYMEGLRYGYEQFL